MPTFDPAQPATDSDMTSAPIRDNFNALKDQVDGTLVGPPGPPGPPFAQAVVETVSTVGPDDAATVGVLFDGSNVRFSFGIPRGHDGAPGADGGPGGPGPTGGQGEPGPTGPPFASMIVDGVTTLGPDEPATASVSFDGANVHLSLGIPRGHDGGQGEQGQPGEVSQANLDANIAGTARNPVGIGPYGGDFSDPPTQQEMRDYRDYQEALRQAIFR